MDITRLASGRRTAAAVAVTALGAVAPWVPAPALATTSDPSGDVVLRGVVDDSQTVDPDWDNGDIIGTTPSNIGREVVVKVNFEDLRKDVDSFTHELRVKTPRHEYQLFAFANEERWRGQFLLFRDGDRVPCRDLGHRISYPENEMDVIIPRSCLGRPAWVRVGWRTETWVDVAEETRGRRVPRRVRGRAAEAHRAPGARARLTDAPEKARRPPGVGRGPS